MFNKFRLFLYSLSLFCPRVLFQFCVQKAQFNFTASSRKFRFSRKGSTDTKHSLILQRAHENSDLVARVLQIQRKSENCFCRTKAQLLVACLNLTGAILTSMFSQTLDTFPYHSTDHCRYMLVLKWVHENISFFHGLTAVLSLSLLSEASRSHTRHIRYDISGRMISPSQRPLPDNTQRPQETDIHFSGGIRTRNPSKRGAIDPGLWLLVQWGQLTKTSVSQAKDYQY